MILSLLQSLAAVLGKFFAQVFNNLTRELFKVRHLLVGVVALVFAPINMGLNLVGSLMTQALAFLSSLVEQIANLGIENAPGWWASGSAVMGQLNAVVPIEYCLSTGAVVAGIWLAIQMVRLAVWLYSLIPFKLT